MKTLYYLPALALSVWYMTAVFRGDRKTPVRLKPFLVPPMAAAALACGCTNPWLLSGLMLGWLGDVLLMDPRGFVPGLAAFLLGHIAYIVYVIPRLIPVFQAPVLLTALPVLAVILLLCRRLWPKLGNMKLPVCLYCAAIGCMAFSGLALALCAPAPLSLLFAAGSVLFVISDSLLAIGLFDAPVRYHDHLVMGTYLSAQLLISLTALF